MSRSARPPVVVGIDGSPSSEGALDWGIAEAQARHLPLLVVHALPALADSATKQARRMVDEAAQRAGDAGVDVDTRLTTNAPAPALLAAADDAAVVVVGARGVEGFHRMQLGSVAAALAWYAPCPVVVTREPENAGVGDRVVVGVDGSGGSRAAVEYAFQQAWMRRLSLVAVLAWHEAPPWPALEPPGQPAAEIAERGRRALAETFPSARTGPAIPVLRDRARSRLTGHMAYVLGVDRFLVVDGNGQASSVKNPSSDRSSARC